MFYIKKKTLMLSLKVHNWFFILVLIWKNNFKKSLQLYEQNHSNLKNPNFKTKAEEESNNTADLKQIDIDLLWATISS